MRRSQFTSAVTLAACRGATFELGGVIGGGAAINRSGCRLRGRRAIKAGVGREGQKAFRSTVIRASRSAKPSERQARRTCCYSGPTRKAHKVWQGQEGCGHGGLPMIARFLKGKSVPQIIDKSLQLGVQAWQKCGEMSVAGACKGGRRCVNGGQDGSESPEMPANRPTGSVAVSKSKWGRHCCRPHSHRRVGVHFVALLTASRSLSPRSGHAWRSDV